MTSPDPKPTPPRSARRSLGQLAKEWNIRPLDVWHAAQQLDIPATKMASTVSSTNERRLHDKLFADRGRSVRMTPVGRAVVGDQRGADKSAYLEVTAKIAAVAPPTQAGQDLCSCCEVPVPTRQAQPVTVCLDCVQQGHRDLHGPNRDLDLAHQHAAWFRTKYLNAQQVSEKAHADRRANADRANRWAAALVRVLVDHDATGRCALCKRDPCPVWRKAGQANPGIARKIQDEYYPLRPAALDTKLADGIVTSYGDEDSGDDL